MPLNHKFLSWNLYHDICFNLIELGDIVKSFEYKTTFVACLYFLHIVLEPLSGSQISFEDLCSFTGNTDFAATLEDTVKDVRSCNVTNTGCLEDLSYFSMTDHLLFEDWI